MVDQKKTIFLSYASEDRELAAVLQHVIEEAFPDAFHIFNAFRADAIALSDEWREKLRTAIMDSSLFLVLLSRNSVGKAWIYWETGGAYHRKIPIIPLIGPGFDIGSLPDQLREIQAISLQDEGDLRRLLDRLAPLAGMAHLSPRHDLSTATKRITDLKARFAGKRWSEITTEAIRRYLFSISGEAHLDLRAISYTSETIATSIPEQIERYHDGSTPLRIRVLVRSEYDRFASRPNEVKFNQRIRWRISRAKADWYRWLRQLPTKYYHRALITLEIRDYWWDPSVRALLLGRSEGFFGLYAIKFTALSGPDRTLFPAAFDWVASDTTMAPLSGGSQELLNDVVEWFDHVWDQSTLRTNEAYRCEASETLLELADKKANSEHATERAIARWRSSRSPTSAWEIGNLALPAHYPEDAGGIIDFMACAVLHEATSGAILVCEIRQRGETWEGIGKTSTYLELTGIHPNASCGGQPLRCDSVAELLMLVRSDAEIQWNDKQRDSKVSLFATDFVWLYECDGMIRIIKPEGELLWGLWDSARYVLRQSLTEEAWVEGVQRTESGRSIQQEVFSRLPLEPLSRCYGAQPEIEVSAVFILCPDTKDDVRTHRIENSHVAQGLLSEAIQSAPHHPSQFWRRSEAEIHRHNDLARRIVRAISLDKLPPVFSIRGRVPFGSVAEVIRSNWVKAVR